MSTASFDGLGCARSEAAVGVTFSISLGACEAAEGETTVAGEGSRGEVGPVPTTLLLRVTRVVGVGWAFVSREIVEALWSCQYVRPLLLRGNVTRETYCGGNGTRKGEDRDRLHVVTVVFLVVL